jgi:diacylglycerol kinase family enzyme
VLLSNVGTLTGPLRWGPHIKPDDGRIDISVIRGRDVFDYMMAAYDVLPGSSRKAWHIRYLSATKSVTVTVDPPTMIQGDGDLVGETPLEAKVAAGAVRVMVPGSRGVEVW